MTPVLDRPNSLAPSQFGIAFSLPCDIHFLSSPPQPLRRARFSKTDFAAINLDSPHASELTMSFQSSTIELKDDTVIVVLGASGDLAKKKTVRVSLQFISSDDSLVCALLVSKLTRRHSSPHSSVLYVMTPAQTLEKTAISLSNTQNF